MHFAADEGEARRIVAGICADEGIARVVKSKSMASEEVSLNSALEGAGVDVVETDLGEFVVQAMGDRPGHVIAPILHRTKDEVQKMRAEQDPIERVKQRVLEKKWASEDELKAIDKEVRAIVAESAEFAQNSPEPDPSELYTDVLIEVGA